MMPADTFTPRRRRRVPRTAPGIRTDRLDERHTILRAAVRTFARHGFFPSGLRDVARAANVSSRTVGCHFKDKDDLLVAIFDGMIGEAIDEGRAALESVSDPIARLDEIARLHLARMGHDRDLAVVCQVELRQSVKFMERFSSTRLREYLGIIRDAIAAGQQRGVFRDGLKPTIAAKMFFGILDQMATNWVLSPRPYPLEAEAALVVDLFVNGIASRAPLPAEASRFPSSAPRPRRRAGA
jgi:TetR/AcrR family fatty acid metabolism transcriptional regulator